MLCVINSFSAGTGYWQRMLCDGNNKKLQSQETENYWSKAGEIFLGEPEHTLTQQNVRAQSKN